MQPKAILTLVYYIVMIFTLIIAMIGYKLAIIEGIYIEPHTTTATAIYTIILLYVLISIPFSLKYFHQKVKGIINIANDGSREKAYIRYGVIRLVLVGMGLIVSIFAYFLLRQNSLMWLSGISAIALIFCRPNGAKIDLDLHPEEIEAINELDHPVENKKEEQQAKDAEVSEPKNENETKETVESKENNL